jgi:hypothetical protein
MRDLRRITLVSRGANQLPREWNACRQAANRIIFVGTFSVLSFALDHAAQDVDRILIDGTARPEEFLNLLTTLPAAFLGDVLLMRDRDTSYLSSAGRASGRLLYALTPADMQFYLETHGLVTQVAVAA